MSLTGMQWIKASLSLSLVSIFSFLIVIPIVLSTLNIEAQPESIKVQNTIVTAPLTVVVPITIDAQNAQICVSAASSGDQSCTQMILNPEQNSYESVTVDLSDPTSVPAVTAVSPGVSKTITPTSQMPDTASTNAPQPPVINIQNTAVTQPLTVTIPIETDAQNAQICVTILSSGSQSCQQVVLNPETGLYTPVTVDLSQPTPTITPQETTQTASSSPTPNEPQSINVEHTEVIAPITVMVPITGDVQNAQICVSAGSTGDQSCTQVIVNPEQTAYTPVNADLTEPGTPTVSSAVEQEPTATTATTTEPTATATQTAPTTTTEPTAPTTTTETAPTTTTTPEQPTGDTTDESTPTTDQPSTDLPSTDTGTEEGGSTEEPSTEGGTSEGSSLEGGIE
jgi:hypothetical protein